MAIKSKDILIVIPARYKSSRFPGKPLVKINGIEMIKRTYERCTLSNQNKKNIIVATDSKKIFNFCKINKMNVLMTSKKCLTGTDRVAEVAKKTNFKYYINLQGDEPVFDVNDLNKILAIAKSGQNDVVNGYSEIRNKNQFRSLSIPKLIFSKKKFLIYMSRQPIPTNALTKNNKAYRQICIYLYPRKKLLRFKKNFKTQNEKAEDIEILRFLEMGINVKMIELSNKSISVDNPSDVKIVESYLKKNH